MKRQLERLKGKRLVTGDANLMTKNEICINTTSDGGVEVKEIGVDGKIKDLASSGSKEYDDLHSFLYYDDRIITIGDVEGPLCTLVADIMIQLLQNYPTTNSIVKVSNLKDIFGINFGNYVPLDAFLKGSGDLSVFYSFKGISIPKYVFPEYLMVESGVPIEIDKLHIFDLIKLLLGDAGAEDIVEFLKTQPTITREEFFDLLK